MGDNTEQVHPAGRKPPTPICKATSMQRTQKTQLERPKESSPGLSPANPPAPPHCRPSSVSHRLLWASLPQRLLGQLNVHLKMIFVSV